MPRADQRNRHRAEGTGGQQENDGGLPQIGRRHTQQRCLCRTVFRHHPSVAAEIIRQLTAGHSVLRYLSGYDPDRKKCTQRQQARDPRRRRRCFMKYLTQLHGDHSPQPIPMRQASLIEAFLLSTIWQIHRNRKVFLRIPSILSVVPKCYVNNIMSTILPDQVVSVKKARCGKKY